MVANVETQALDILVTGLSQSGKSTFLHTISRRITAGAGDLEGWMSGDLAVDESLNLRFLEPPASKTFDFLWFHNLIDGVEVPGFIVLCDSSMPELFGEAIFILETIRACHPDAPCILVANKQDDDFAWGAIDIQLGLGIREDILVLPCIATDREAVKEVVLQLLYQIMSVE